MTQFDDLIREAADTHGVDANLLKRMVQAESNFNPQARSPKGAMGLMQLMPGTARDLGVEDPFDPRQNVMGGARYLRQMLDRFGDETLAVAAYNAGPGRVEKAGGVPRISETMNYVSKVVGGGLKALSGGLGVREAWAGDEEDQVSRRYLKRQETIPSREEVTKLLHRLSGKAQEMAMAASQASAPGGLQPVVATSPTPPQGGDLPGQEGSRISTTGVGTREDLTRVQSLGELPRGERQFVNRSMLAEDYARQNEMGIPSPENESLQQPWIDPVNVLAGFGTGAIKGGVGVALRSLLGNVLGEGVGGVTGEILSEAEKPGWAWAAALAVDMATGMATDKALGLAARRLRRARPDVTEAQAVELVNRSAENPEVQAIVAEVRQASLKAPGAVREAGSDEFSRKAQEFYDLVAADSGNRKQQLVIAPVTEAEAAILREKTGVEVAGYTHTMDNYALRHIMARHGDPAREAKQGQIAVVREDFDLIPDIIGFPDAVGPGGKTKQGRDTVRYQKQFNGITYYLEEVRTGKNELATVTMWKKPAGAPDASPAKGEVPPAQTSETFPGLIETTIEAAGPDVKWIQNVPVESIKTDPEVFQFKQNFEAKTGAGLALGDVKKWDDKLSGILTLWRSPEGELYVVNGHQRLALARKQGVKEIRAQVLDASEFTQEQARAMGALINMSEGRGTTVDMAKYLKDTGSTSEQLAEEGISLSEIKTQQAVSLSNLSDPVFQAVTLGKLSPEKAAVIGQILPDNPAAQEALFSFLARAEERGQSIGIEKVRELARLGREAGLTSKMQTTLFGEEEMKKSLLMEQADLLAYARQRLKSDKKLFGVTAREKGRLEEAGNLIDPDTNQAISEEAGRALFMLEKGAYDGESQANALLKEYSRRLAEWRNKSAVRTEFYDKLKEALKADTETIMGLDFGIGSLMKKVRESFGRTGRVWNVMSQAEGLGVQGSGAKPSGPGIEPIVTRGTADRERIASWLKGDISPDEWEMPVHINWNRIEAPEDVEKIYADLVKLQAEEFQAAGRFIRPHEVTEKAARLHGMTVEELAQRQEGAAFNAEEVLRSQQIAVSAVTELERRSAALRALGDAATAQDQADFFNFFRLASHLAAQARGGLTETARGLEAAKIARKAQPGLTEKMAELDSFARGVWGPQDAGEIAEYVSRLETPAQTVSFLKSVGKAVEKGTDILYHYWINALLSGPKTLVANITGMVNIPAQIMERAVAAKIGGGVAEGEAAAMVYGAWQGFKDGLRLAGKTLKTGEDLSPWSSRLDIPPEKRNPLSAPNLGLDPGSLLGKGIDLLGEIVSTPTRRVMGAVDALGGSIGMRMELNALAYRQAWKEGLEGGDMARRIREILDNPGQYEFIYEQGLNMAKAVNYANDLGFLGQKVKQVFSYGPLKWVGPFIRAGGNLANFVIDRSPMALATRKFWSDLQSPQAAVRDLALARFGLGTTIMGLGMYLASDGWITGSGPRDPALRATWEQTGWQSNSVFNPMINRYVSFNRSDPLGMHLGIAADLFEIAHQVDADNLDRAFFYAVTSMGRQLVSKTYLRGVSGLLDAWEDPEHKGGRYWSDFAGSFIPTIIKDVARMQEPGPRETGTGVERFVNTLKGRLPGFTREVEPQLDFWANPKTMDGSWPRAIYDFFLPFYLGKDGSDQVDRELMRLGYPLRKPGYVIEVGGLLRGTAGQEIEAVRLNPTQYNRYLEISRNEVGGQPLKKALNGLINSSLYESRPDEIKAMAIKDVISRYQQAAKAKLLEEFPDLKEQILSTKMIKRGAAQ